MIKRFALLFVLLAAPAAAQGTADLDRLYTSRDWRGVSERLRQANSEAEALAALQWAAAKVLEGAPHAVALAYADLLWRIGQGRNDESVKHEAAIVTLYSVALAAVDGAACLDRTAIEARVNQILSATGPRITLLRNLSAEQRKDARARVTSLEQTTFLRRPEDQEICRAGQGEITRQLQAPGTNVIEQPLRPGQASRTVDIVPGPTYRPRMYTLQEARVRREVQRQQRLPALLRDLVPN